jgi:hypothetical protein
MTTYFFLSYFSAHILMRYSVKLVLTSYNITGVTLNVNLILLYSLSLF